MLRTAGCVSVALLALAGCCGGNEVPETVTGRVLYRGAPLAGGTIVFAPDPEHGGDGPIAWGEIGPDGRYTLHTKPGEDISPGWHRVTFAAASGSTLPAHYSDPARSGQTCEIKAGTANQIDFELK
jgi:hypothetical protein